MTTIATQIPLRLTPQALYQIDNFYFSQQELNTVVLTFCQQSTPQFLYVWGDAAAGKTHLALAIVEHAQKKHGKRSLYLPLAELVEQASPAVLESLEKQSLVCIDELEAVEGNSEWEEALFHCFNRLQEAGCQLLIMSRRNPTTLKIHLPDLQSRLAAGLVYQLDNLNDSAKQHVMMAQSRARGLEMSLDVAQYILHHHSRDLSALMAFLAALDKASMAAQRRLTLPFVRQVLRDDQN
jgi:DnaA family protein